MFTGLIAVGALVAGVLAPPAPAAASADPCDPNHCYGLVRLFKSVGRGIKVHLGVTHLEHNDPNNQIATAEMWTGLADGKGGRVELGQIYGVWCSPRRQYFSAATTTTGFVLHCHGSAANTTTKTPIRIEHGASAAKWNIFIDST